jgi:hypothetical protein
MASDHLVFVEGNAWHCVPTQDAHHSTTDLAMPQFPHLQNGAMSICLPDGGLSEIPIILHGVSNGRD